MKIGPLPDAMPDAVKPGFHCVRTHWIRGFMAFRLVRRIRTVMLMVLVGPESDFGACCLAAGHQLAGNVVLVMLMRLACIPRPHSSGMNAALAGLKGRRRQV
jgi:hypothetical protein